MIRTTFLILALALYGAYSLLSSFWSTAPESAEAVSARATSTAPASSSLLSLTSAGDLAVLAASKMSGVDLQPLPEQGCSDSVLSPQQVLDLLDRLPDGQRMALAKALNASSGVWTAQLYSGADGIGLCLPAYNRMLRLPTASAQEWVGSPGEITDMARTAVDSLRP